MTEENQTLHEQNEAISRLAGIVGDLRIQLADKEAAMRELRAMKAVIKLKYPKTYKKGLVERWESHPMAVDDKKDRKDLREEAKDAYREEGTEEDD